MEPLNMVRIEDFSIPYFYRDAEKFIAVRMIESQLLRKYPKDFMKKIVYDPPLPSHFMSKPEASMLNSDGGSAKFSERDLVIALKDFLSFNDVLISNYQEALIGDKVPEARTPYHGVKSRYAMSNNKIRTSTNGQTSMGSLAIGARSRTIAASNCTQQESNVNNKGRKIHCNDSRTRKRSLSVDCQNGVTEKMVGATGGWLQINNTVIPFGIVIDSAGELFVVDNQKRHPGAAKLSYESIIDTLTRHFELKLSSDEISAYAITYYGKVQINNLGDQSEGFIINIVNNEPEELPIYIFPYSWSQSRELILGEHYRMKKKGGQFYASH